MMQTLRSASSCAPAGQTEPLLGPPCALGSQTGPSKPTLLSATIRSTSGVPLLGVSTLTCRARTVSEFDLRTGSLS